jgi:hypothetical protein
VNLKAIGKKDIHNFFFVLLLLVPGFLNALFSLLISSNRLFPDRSGITFFLINTAQLQGLGLVIAKCGVDQMLFAKLSQNEFVPLRHFFLKRVFPLTILFCLFLCLTKQPLTSLFFLFCVPVEVYVNIVVCELNISRRYHKSLLLNMFGYPFIFIAYILLSYCMVLNIWQVLIIFFVASIVKLIYAQYLRKLNTIKKEDALLFSYYVPVLQVSNYLIFKADQVIISSNLMNTFFFRFMLPVDFLFFTKFTDLFSGIAGAFAPILAKFQKNKTGINAVSTLFKNPYFIALNLGMIILQIAISALLLKHFDVLHIKILIPYLITTLLIVPVNMLNYEFYKKNELKISSAINIVALIAVVFITAINMIIKSPVFFAYTVPIQLVLVLLLSIFYLRPVKEEVK